MSQPLLISRYRSIIASMPPIMELSKEELLIDKLHVRSIIPLELYYAPHNDVALKDAKLMIAGLTPGIQQMRLALAEAQEAIWEGASDEQVCYRAKLRARFAGTMRNNLISMLDQLRLPQWLGLDSKSSSSLFYEQFTLLDSTSIIPLPAFYKGKNYSGSQPELLKHGPLCHFIEEHMRKRLGKQPNIPIIPLGRAVEGVMALFVRRGLLDKQQVLWGFPHPSGANGHRHQQFSNYEQQMKEIVKGWYSS